MSFITFFTQGNKSKEISNLLVEKSPCSFLAKEADDTRTYSAIGAGYSALNPSNQALFWMPREDLWMKQFFVITFNDAPKDLQNLKKVWNDFFESSSNVKAVSTAGITVLAGHFIYKAFQGEFAKLTLLFTGALWILSRIADQRRSFALGQKEYFENCNDSLKRMTAIQEFRKGVLEKGIQSFKEHEQKLDLQGVDKGRACELLTKREKAFLLAKYLNEPEKAEEFYENLLPFDLESTFKKAVEKDFKDEQEYWYNLERNFSENCDGKLLEVLKKASKFEPDLTKSFMFMGDEK